GARGGLQPWFDAALPPRDEAGEDDVALDTLRRFLCEPAGQFLAQSLGLRLADDVDAVDDLEPLVRRFTPTDTANSAGFTPPIRPHYGTL
ncbi:hypothetical protein KC218_23580, partial [Mycobacterium tuberculosis]|nr:hypothetical protein [Mycobacterium tuberculosis]